MRARLPGPRRAISMRRADSSASPAGWSDDRSQGIASQGLHMQGTAAKASAARALACRASARRVSACRARAPAPRAHREPVSRRARSRTGRWRRSHAARALGWGAGRRGAGRSCAAKHGPHPELWLYALQLDGRNVCDDDGLGAFVPGIWDESGRHVTVLDTPGGAIDATFSCRAGVIAKCVFWGYAPWSAGAELHQMCTRMARADYCGDGVSHTENGTLIDMFDTHAIQTTVNAPELSHSARRAARQRLRSYLARVELHRLRSGVSLSRSPSRDAAPARAAFIGALCHGHSGAPARSKIQWTTVAHRVSLGSFG